MRVLLNILNQTATNIMESGAESQAGENAVTDLAVNAIGPYDPVAYTLWGIAVLAIAGIWYLLSKPAYTPRRFRRPVGVGPLTHLKNTIANKFYSFLP